MLRHECPNKLFIALILKELLDFIPSLPCQNVWFGKEESKGNRVDRSMLDALWSWRHLCFGEPTAPLPLRKDKEFRIRSRLKLGRSSWLLDLLILFLDADKKQRFVNDILIFTNNHLRKKIWLLQTCKHWKWHKRFFWFVLGGGKGEKHFVFANTGYRDPEGDLNIWTSSSIPQPPTLNCSR